MNKKYLYLISGLLLCICVLIAYQVTQAAISNPGHGTSALEGNASLNMNSNKIINLSSPTLDSDAATKAYADAAVPESHAAFCFHRYNAEGLNGACTACPAAPTGWIKLTGQLAYYNWSTTYAICDCCYYR